MTRSLAILALCAVTRAQPAAAQAVAADSQLPCTKVPGIVVAATLGGRVTNTIDSGWLDPGEARCRYYLRSAGSDTTSRIYVLYIQPASDYAGLKENAPAATRDVAGVGDAAYMFIDPDTKRFWLTAVRRGGGGLSVTVSGPPPDFESVRKLAALALSRYR